MDQPSTDADSPELSNRTSLSMLDRVRVQDSDAWRRLVHIYSPLVFFWGRRAGLQDQDAADVLQEVWKSVSTNISRFERDSQSGTFRGWLWTIARNKINDHFRKKWQKPEAEGGSTALNQLRELPEQEPVEESENESRGVLHRALELIRSEFEEHTFQAFWRTTVDGQSASEVGTALGMLPNAVYQAKSRVLRRLREEMAGLIEG
jgi:RNA polymerase sigma-70 factor, ECF subfamily